MKRHLEALLARERGFHAFPLVRATISNMTEAEAEQWFRLLTSIKSEAEAEGARKGARQPWRHGGI